MVLDWNTRYHKLFKKRLSKSNCENAIKKIIGQWKYEQLWFTNEPNFGIE